MNQLQRARASFTRAGKLNEASAVDTELKKLEANRNLAPANDDALQNPFEPGAIWHGMRRMPRGGLVPYELHIESRQGNTFDGQAFGYQGNRWEVEGTIDVDTIKWQVVGGNRVGDTFVGKLNGTELNYTFKGANDDKEGRATLTLRKPGKAPQRSAPVDGDR
jgi:hypothetical protein